MAKLKFQPNPTFKLLVSVPIAGQLEDEEVTFTVKYLTRKQLGEMVEKADESLYDYLCRSLKYLVVGWDLDVEFNEQNLDILLDNYPQIPERFKDKYLKEYLGNAEKN
ncbi:phage tail assembly chaperone [Conchiformibius steedae]|uniref:Phage tail assembly protein n=1 Tax=Conchiformibius steedae TaxID=153493 RepID=A0A3P2A830_9NEIS|nr:phage tail assembly chaperone [Conchiformibius steedae]RRD90430.1 hypothetical protein EII21_05795 [Conchiformibius steedae]